MVNIRKFYGVISLVVVLILALAANDAFVFAQGGVDVDKEASTPEQEFLGDDNTRAVTYGRVSISPAAFHPEEEMNDKALFDFDRTNSTELNFNSWPFFLAPLSIPDGVTVTRFVLGYYDANPDGVIWIRLYRQEIWGGAVEEMAVASSVTDTGYYFRIDETIDHALIDQGTYTYFIKAKFNDYDEVYKDPTSVRLVGVRVDYQNPTTTYLPLVDN